MRKIISTLILLCYFFAFTLSGQNWVGIEHQLNAGVTRLFKDNITNELVLSGMFSKSANSRLYGYGRYQYDRIIPLKRDSIDIINPIPLYNGSKTYHNFNGTRIAVNHNSIDTVNFEEDNCTGSVYFLNSNNIWKSIDEIPDEASSWHIFSANNSLVVTCIVPTLDTADKFMYIFDDQFNLINTIPNPYSVVQPNFVLCSTNFLGKTILGGNFTLAPDSMAGICSWNPVTGEFGSIGGGVLGLYHSVIDMEVFDGKLVLAGGFAAQSGNAGDNFMSWDGSNWLPYPPGFLGSIMDITTHNGILYVCGAFNNINGLPVNGLAYFDGSQWNAIPLTINNGYPNCCEVFNDTLFVGGNFTMLNNDSIKYFAKYTQPLPVGINYKIKSNLLSLSPNPCTSTLTVSSVETPFQYQFFNLHGQEVVSGTSTSKQLNVTALKPGVYFLKVKDRNGTRTGKVVKVEP